MVKEWKDWFECSECKGLGYLLHWGYKSLEVKDCDRCGGKGKIFITILDSRQNSEDKKLELNKVY